LAGCCECGDEPSGSGAAQLVIYFSQLLSSEERVEILFFCREKLTWREMAAEFNNIQRERSPISQFVTINILKKLFSFVYSPLHSNKSWPRLKTTLPSENT
jgi:hypothetical protein